jgi:protease I
MAKVVIIVGEGFEDSEFEAPFEALTSAGHKIDIMGTNPDGEVHGKRGRAVVRIDVSAKQSYPDHYDALIIPGGFGPDRLRTDKDIVAFVEGFMNTGKPVAAICHGPQLLIEADSVRGLTLTSWPSIKTDLINAGATWIDEELVIDKNLITSRKPDDLNVFCDAIQQALAQTPAHRSHIEQGKNKSSENAVPDVKLDEEGFLQNSSDWNEQLATWLAHKEGIDELSESCWQVIYALREYYQQHRHVPDFRQLCEAAHQKDVYCMQRLFKNDGSKAWRIAGLPNPGEEIKTYL